MTTKKTLVLRFGSHEEAEKYAELTGGTVERLNLWAVRAEDGKAVREIVQFAVSVEEV